MTAVSSNRCVQHSLGCRNQKSGPGERKKAGRAVYSSLTTKNTSSALFHDRFLFGNILRGKLAASGGTGTYIMLFAIELITVLLLGFVLGRIWQIRKGLILTEDVRRRLDESSVARNERPQADRSYSTLSDHRYKVPAAPAPALHLRNSPSTFAGRFRALHQSLQHAGGNA
jgi:hypothetical protein